MAVEYCKVLKAFILDILDNMGRCVVLVEILSRQDIRLGLFVVQRAKDCSFGRHSVWYARSSNSKIAINPIYL